MKRFVFWVSCITIGGALAYGLVVVATLLSPFTLASSGSGSTAQMDYSDFVSIMLTGVSLILAALGFVVALIAVIGWNSIGDRVSSLSTKLFTDSLDEDGELRELVRVSLQEGGELYDLVQEEAKDIIYRGVQAIDEDNDVDTDVEE